MAKLPKGGGKWPSYRDRWAGKLGIDALPRVHPILYVNTTTEEQRKQGISSSQRAPWDLIRKDMDYLSAEVEKSKQLNKQRYNEGHEHFQIVKEPNKKYALYSFPNQDSYLFYKGGLIAKDSNEDITYAGTTFRRRPDWKGQVAYQQDMYQDKSKTVTALTSGLNPRDNWVCNDLFCGRKKDLRWITPFKNGVDVPVPVEFEGVTYRPGYGRGDLYHRKDDNGEFDKKHGIIMGFSGVPQFNEKEADTGISGIVEQSRLTPRVPEKEKKEEIKFEPAASSPYQMPGAIKPFVKVDFPDTMYHVSASPKVKLKEGHRPKHGKEMYGPRPPGFYVGEDPAAWISTLGKDRAMNEKGEAYIYPVDISRLNANEVSDTTGAGYKQLGVHLSGGAYVPPQESKISGSAVKKVVLGTPIKVKPDIVYWEDRARGVDEEIIADAISKNKMGEPGTPLYPTLKGKELEEARAVLQPKQESSLPPELISEPTEEIVLQEKPRYEYRESPLVPKRGGYPVEQEYEIREGAVMPRERPKDIGVGFSTLPDQPTRAVSETSEDMFMTKEGRKEARKYAGSEEQIDEELESLYKD